LTCTGEVFVSNYIRHAGDTNSYILFSAADDFRIVSGGRELVRLDEGANPDIAKFMTDEFRMYSDGNFHADGNITAYSTTTSSDRRLKKNVQPITNALDKVQALKGVTFDWKNEVKGKDQLGFIAQDFEKVLPSMVTEVDSFDDDKKIKTINYGSTVALLVEAIKDQQTEINNLKSLVQQLLEK
jgi:hypothetical protein